MNHSPDKRPRFETPQRGALPEDLLDEIDTLALALAATAEATASGRVPIAARADYLRAQAAHRRALAAWTAASGEHQLDPVRELLGECRAALESSRGRLRR